MTVPPFIDEPPARVAKPLLAGLAVFVLAFTAAGYAWLGNRAGLEVSPEQPRQQLAALDEMVERLAQRLRGQPDDAEGWAMLARSYTVIGRLPEAMEGFIQATRRAEETGNTSHPWSIDSRAVGALVALRLGSWATADELTTLPGGIVVARTAMASLAAARPVSSHMRRSGAGPCVPRK